ncbi:hypothetical protein GP486_002430 [Trichoglossum hirsutum]|uniref:Methyltransferase type 12 domain-containing protein n=1 Tax=Trichoglossum hirsutum TaxID=265104 RepID=A0A9P8LF88_9PEZI|nr:hypothetical protein GP486_002430 [Trichoglossum hirsutum]
MTLSLAAREEPHLEFLESGPHLWCSPPERMESEESEPALGLRALSVAASPEQARAATEPAAAALPPHRSHDPRDNLKRSDPFQFGSRYLLEDDDVFEFNAWDHVETDAAYQEYAELQYAKQREYPVGEFDKKRFNSDPARWWDLFYRNNATNFFKNRKWLQQEFPVLTAATQPGAPPTTILEVGAGAGNTAFPILAQNRNPNLKIHAVDFSRKAVELIRHSEHYDPRFIQADVWDVTDPSSLPPGIAEGSVDVVLLIFIFSALSPDQWRRAVRNVYRVLKPGGEVCLRDYGRGDLAQVRFKKGRWMESNFYVRGDGTRVYFFEKEELAAGWRGVGADVMRATARTDDAEGEGSGKEDGDGLEGQEEKDERTAERELFEVVDLGVDRRLLVNRQRKLKMYRCWLQGRFRKGLPADQPKPHVATEPALRDPRESESS